LRALPPPERRERLASDEFRDEYTPRERRFLAAFARMLAPPPPQQP
jgi:hypothetical protein